MAATQQNKDQFSTSDIELSFADSEERTRRESQISTDAPQLELLHHCELDAANSDDCLRSSRERVPSTALNYELPNAPLLEKQSDLPLGWPTSPRPVKISFGSATWKILVDLLLLVLSLTFLAFALFVIWYNDFPENAEFLYIVPSPWLWLPDYELFKPTLDSSYLAALMSQTTTQGSPRDTWGHVKVPRIEHYESTSPLGDEGWYSTENSTLESYSSFIGVPMSGMNSPEFIDYSTTIQAKYFHLECDRYLDDSDDWDAQFTFNTTRWLGYVYWNENVTSRAEIPPDEVEPFAFVIVSNSLLGLIWDCTIQTTNVEVFKAHFGWVIALIVSSTVLIGASLVPFYLRTFLPHGPDVLMNFSSLAARDNPYVALPATGTYPDAADRSRLLKDVRIRFGDVEEGGEIGRLAIGRADGDVAPLRKERKYA
ncbi:uncharacterized protein J4E84_010387 [Alternaria hordeiaustralica]|uniref:uncharacterized protein n=1 Tax=Alternaria hordeiaustralica TaxID=1187925 RepID=UPI0020C2D246|nr:uncharacterized protein J4E84_010387 [Alternaria hordeiaustralica]KAI4674781.1 hypothetical protein J4E84_010387 [Alternaria hordeiaustralica]